MLLVFTGKETERLRYILDWIFERWAVKFSVSHDIAEYEQYEGPKIFYGNEKPGAGIFIRQAGILEDDSLKIWDIEISRMDSIPIIFANDSDIGFDIFSAAFYMISRYEEYLPFNTDAHGRFPAFESLAFKNGFLEIPVVDQWIGLLQKHLKSVFLKMEFGITSMSVLPTYDIDVAYKFEGRNFLRWMGGSCKSLIEGKIKTLGKRLMVLVNAKQDPWDVYNFIESDLKGCNAWFFFLSGTNTMNDRNLNPLNKKMQLLFKRVSAFGKIGLHPSYHSFKNLQLIQNEKFQLEKASGCRITGSRQHFLKFVFPDTFLNLLEAGITKDFSMGFPEAPGFRAGTAYPFYFYDLKNERKTALQLFPCCWMDYTFDYYLKQKSDQAISKALELISIIKKTGGIFIPVFHNDLLELWSQKQRHSTIIAELLKHGR